MTLTSPQVLWVQGFWSYFQDATRPTKAGPKRDGWDTAQRCSRAGGYA